MTPRKGLVRGLCLPALRTSRAPVAAGPAFWSVPSPTARSVARARGTVARTTRYRAWRSPPPGP